MEQEKIEKIKSLRGSDTHVRIIGLYFGSLAEWTAEENAYRKPGERFRITADNVQGIVNNLRNYSIVVKRLEDISDGDAEIVSAIQRPDTVPSVEHGRAIVNGLFADSTHFKVSVSLKLIDYLRLSSHALPYGKYSVNQLVEAGIFKLDKF